MASNSVCKKFNRELATKLRFENQEQYNTLVRMHLSFELDLQTEENEDTGHERGLFKKQLNKFSKKTKPGCTSNKRSNSPEDDQRQFLSRELIQKLSHIMEFLVKEENLIQEGIFRRTGSVARQNELKNTLLLGKQVIDLGSGDYTVHDCASVLKGILSDLPEPLLLDSFYSAHCQLAALCNNQTKDAASHQTIDDRLTIALQLLFLLLPIENRELLEDLMKLLHKTTEYTDRNKMNSDTLATLFTPHLICPRKLSPENLHSVSQQMSSVVSFMISKGELLFDVPAKLNTDIRMYFVDQKRKRTMSPEMMLDESVTSDSTAATVYTFIDREKTAQAHDSNPTDTALAQLYAHIQSLPESSKKRKLIKQFNKENGHGTPLQLLMFNRMKQPGSSAKSSLGDSIKRHIFSKSLLPKTPKRSHCTSASVTPSSFTTPNRPKFYVANKADCGPSSPPKKRVLFQSPLNPESLNRVTKTHVQTTTATNPINMDQKDPVGKQKEVLKTQAALENKIEKKLLLGRKFPSEPNLSGSESELCEEKRYELERRKFRVSLSHLDEGVRQLQVEEKCPSLNGTHQSFLADERNSMSPITKSTQRMPKYMQESIMTPRSRKPVMLLGLTLGNSSTNSISSLQAKSCSFREEDEDSLELNKSKSNSSDLMKISSFEATTTDTSLDQQYTPKDKKSQVTLAQNPDSLTSTFRDYLISRSVLSSQTSPADLSFSSQPDDFGSNLDMRDLSASEMTKSMLYCLDGNKPTEVDDSEDDDDDSDFSEAEKENLQQYRKRRSDEIQLSREEEQEIKKLVLNVQNTASVGETSL